MVPSDVLLSDLHKIIQTIMGWTNSHLHQFIKGRDFYEPTMPEELMMDSSGIDYTGIRLNDLLKKEKETMIYEYDFGDGWEHEIRLEKVLPFDESTPIPVCIDGARDCPPEDCGGIWGYSELLKIVKNPAHEEYEDYMAWLPENFDPDYFDIDDTNKALKTKDYGCIEFW